MHLVEATKLLSTYHLHPEIIQIKEDKDMPTATVLYQKPKAGRLIKKNQTIYLVVSERPASYKTPSCIGLSTEQITMVAQSMGLKPKFYHIPYSYLTDRCFGQWPSAGQPIKNRTFVCYIATQEEKHVVCPNFKGVKLDDVTLSLKNHSIDYQTDIIPEQSRIYYVLEQHPKAGSILNLKEPTKLNVQLKIGLKPVKSTH